MMVAYNKLQVWSVEGFHGRYSDYVRQIKITEPVIVGTFSVTVRSELIRKNNGPAEAGPKFRTTGLFRGGDPGGDGVVMPDAVFADVVPSLCILGRKLIRRKV